MNIDVEFVRHITHGNLRRFQTDHNFRSEMLDIEVPALFPIISLVDWVSDAIRNGEEKNISEPVLREEFPFLEDAHFEEPETEVHYIANKLKKRYATHIHRKGVYELAEASPDKFQETYVRLSRQMQEVLADTSHQVSGSQYGELIQEHWEAIGDKTNTGVSLGFGDIDKHTGGIRDGHLAILAALPKRFKTWFLIKAFVDRIARGENPIFFSLELSVLDIVGRIGCLLSGVSYNRYIANNILPHEKKAVSEALSGLGGTVSQPVIGDRYVPSLFAEAERVDADSIIIDQFSFLHPVGDYFRENEGYKEIVYDLKNGAVTYDTSIYMAAQLNREAVKEGDFPVAQHLGLTRALEEASDLIMGIRISDELREEHQAELGVVEGRYCESGPNARWLIEYDFYKGTTFDAIL